MTQSWRQRMIDVVATHTRESATPTDLLGARHHRHIVGVCNCGVAYRVAQGPDEYSRLNEAHANHVATLLADIVGPLIEESSPNPLGADPHPE